jgi:glycosyltransferase involved in cell wall biosynthesis
MIFGLFESNVSPKDTSSLFNHGKEINKMNSASSGKNWGLVSVIVPVYKGKAFLREALESVRCQSYRSWELIVVEDGAEEKETSYEIVEKFSSGEMGRSIRYFQNHRRSGPAYSRNKAIREANGKYIAFLDCDDMWEKSHLENSLIQLEWENADVAYCSAFLFGLGIESPDSLYGPTDEEISNFPASLYDRNYILLSGCVVDSKIFSHAGLFDPSMYMGEDWDYCLKLIRAGFRFSYNPRPTCYYRRHSDNLTLNRGLLIQCDAKISIKHMGWALIPFHRRVKRAVLSNYYFFKMRLKQICQKILLQK